MLKRFWNSLKIQGCGATAGHNGRMRIEAIHHVSITGARSGARRANSMPRSSASSRSPAAIQLPRRLVCRRNRPAGSPDRARRRHFSRGERALIPATGISPCAWGVTGRRWSSFGPKATARMRPTWTCTKCALQPHATAGFPQIYILDPDRNMIEINAEVWTDRLFARR